MAPEWPPAPPDGYQKHDPEYGQSWLVTVILFCWLIGVLVAIPALVVSVHDPDTAVRIVREVLQPDTADEWTAYIVWLILRSARWIRHA